MGRELLQLTDDLAICVHHVAAVRRTDEDSCAIYMVGQSAIDGSFLVQRDFESVIEEINERLADQAED